MTDVKTEVKKIVKFTEEKPQLSTDNCAPESDPAFVNFDPQQMKDPKGFHGMLFFGQGETFYISHLPMYHKPHDYQAIVEVRLKPDVKAKYQASLAANGGYFTFSPADTFVLPDQVINKKPISGSLVQGHFERGGNELLSTDLEIVRVVFYKKLNPTEKKLEKEKYIIFGKGSEYFMAHEIGSRPNTDEIIPLPKDAPLSDKMKMEIKQNGLARADEVEIKGDKLKAKKGKDSIEFDYKEFYRETGDLQ